MINHKLADHLPMPLHRIITFFSRILYLAVFWSIKSFLVLIKTINNLRQVITQFSIPAPNPWTNRNPFWIIDVLYHHMKNFINVNSITYNVPNCQLQPLGFMESAIPYSSIEDVNIISRWDAGQKFCIRITIADGSLLLQVSLTWVDGIPYIFLKCPTVKKLWTYWLYIKMHSFKNNKYMTDVV